jgi:RNA polymerase sigma factor (sigma-70 family)
MINFKNISFISAEEEAKLLDESRLATAAFDRLVESYLPKLWDMVRNYPDAEDLFQDCTLTLMESIRGYDTNSGRTLSEHVQSNVKAHIERKTAASKKERRYNVPITDGRVTGSVPARERSHESEIRNREADRQLPERDRHILELVHFDGLGITEIAVTFKCTPADAGAMYEQALDRLALLYRLG